MKALFLTPELPYPPDRGASIRTFNLMKNLVSHHQIHLLSFAGEGEPREPGPLLKICSRVEMVDTPQRSPLQRFFSLLFSSQPDMALRLPSAEYEGRLSDLLGAERYDLVQVEGIEMARYMPLLGEAKSAPRLIFDDINAEYLLQRRAFETDLGEFRRWPVALYSYIQWRKLRRYEAWACRQAHRVIAVSEADAQALRSLVPEVQVTVVPNGVDTAHYFPSMEEENDSLVFTGKMDFRPNVDGLLWFFHQVWPQIREAIPQARFLVVGRSPSPRLAPLSRDLRVTVTGYVPDVRPYIARAHLYLVPLRMGGGTRLKVLEAMAMGKAIVSTSFGFEGIEAVPDLHLVVADEPAEFARQVIELWGDEERRRRLGEAARALAERYDWRDIAPLLERVYEEAA